MILSLGITPSGFCIGNAVSIPNEDGNTGMLETMSVGGFRK